MKTCLDNVNVKDGQLFVRGWAFGNDPESVAKYEIRDKSGKRIDTQVILEYRDSVNRVYFRDYKEEHGRPIGRSLGFYFTVPYEKNKNQEITLRITIEGHTKKLVFNDKSIAYINSDAYRKQQKFLTRYSLRSAKKVMKYVNKNGWIALMEAGMRRITKQQTNTYSAWANEVKPTVKQLEEQKKKKFAYMPKFSIVVPIYRTPEVYLRKMLDTVKNQTYANFELLAVDASEYESYPGSMSQGEYPKDVLQEYANEDSRFKFKVLKKNLGISDNTNAAIAMASSDSDFIVLMDHDDELTPDALYECARAVNQNRRVQVIYSDEDKVDYSSRLYFDPHFKSDYNPELLLNVNYITHLFVASTALLDQIKIENTGDTKDVFSYIYEKKEYDGAQDYDFILRCCEQAEKNEKENGFDKRGKTMLEEGRFTSSTIYHVKKVLYHWRSHPNSTAQNPESKLYAYEAGTRAVYDHCVRIGWPIEKVEREANYGFYIPTFHVVNNEKGNQPLVSVVIPNKDHSEDLDLVIRTMFKGTYQNLEVIVVENNSTEPETFAYYEKIQEEYPDCFVSKDDMLEHPVVKVVKWADKFNYSAINNYGVTFTHGDYLLFANNDIEMLNMRSIEDMLTYAQREEIGIVGAKLLYPDDTIQHAGVIVGNGGIAGATFVGIPEKTITYMNRSNCLLDYSAVTAACLMTKKAVFDAVEGYDELLEVAFNDIDFCMKVRTKNLRVVYDPYALFHHYESKSRGLEDTPEKVQRFNGEIVKFARKWKGILEHGDPYYNPNLTLRRSDFSIRDLELDQIGEPLILDVFKDIVKYEHFSD